MRVVFPHMGNLSIGLQGLFERLGIDYANIPKQMKKVLDFGVRYAPEFVCYPFKVNLADFFEGIKQGADTILMVTDSGPCRLGIYGHIQDLILRNIGYDFKVILFDYTNPLKFILKFRELDKTKSLGKIIESFIFGLKKLYLADYSNKLFLKKRPYEVNKNQSAKVYEEVIKLIKKASFYKQLNNLKSVIEEAFNSIDIYKSNIKFRIGIVGEIYMVLEESINFGIEERLSNLGVEVTKGIYLSDSILEVLGWRENSLFSKKRIHKEASKYLRYNVGAECNLSIGRSILYAKQNYDGIIHIMPFTCTPEVIAQSILSKVSKDFNIPILTIIVDEHTQPLAVQTRLEAFVDLLKKRKMQN